MERIELSIPIVPSYTAARTALQTLHYQFRYDVRSSKTIFRRFGGDWSAFTELAASSIRQAIVDQCGFDPRKEHLFDAAAQLAYECVFDPVCEYLDSLKWEGEPLLDTWLPTYFRAEDSEYVRAVGALTLMGAAKRAFEPACKFDPVLTLIGEQGCLKTLGVEALAVRPEWYSDQPFLQLSLQQQQEAVEGIWIYELSELGGLSRAGRERAKADISRRYDRSRKVYARSREDCPRRFIFIATTNESSFLNDPTGNRRFWPVKVGRCRIAKLREDVDQLWAEAAWRVRQGASVNLPKRLWSVAAVAQRERTIEDPWLALLVNIRGEVRNDSERLPFDEATTALGLAPSQQTQDIRKRIDDCMMQLGWEKAKDPFKYKGQTKRGYIRKPT